jgi:hypothetical protein
MSTARLILTIGLIVGAGCASPTRLQPSNPVVTQNALTPSPTQEPAKSRNDLSTEPESAKDVPTEFSAVDFKNRSYPTSLNPSYTPSLRRRNVQLKHGSYEYRDRKGPGGAQYDLRNVEYVDVGGDGKKEAVVRISQVICGASCDGGSDFFYFYSINHHKAKLLSRLETGSLGYDCGLKSFNLKRGFLTLETFRVCRFDGTSIKPGYDKDETGGKFLTNRFTQFILRFNGQRFVLRKRKVFPYPENDFRSYEPKINISND